MSPTEGGRVLRRLLQRIGWRRHRPVRFAIMFARRALGFGLYYSGALTFWRHGGTSRGSPLILMYHSVGGRGLSPDIVVSRGHFEAHIRHVRRHYRLWSLQDVVTLMEAGRPVPGNALVITLDDGYRDNFEEGFDILKRYECPATVFVTVEPVETGRLPWPQALWRHLNATQQCELQVSWQSANGAAIDPVLPLRPDHDRGDARIVLKMFAGGLGPREREDFLNTIARNLGCIDESDEDETRAMLTWDQLREMSRWGISIGGHTMTHPRLSGLDTETVRHELAESRRVLGEELKTDIKLFAYPFGGPDSFNQGTKREVAAAGYTVACSAVVGRGAASVDLQALDRVYIPDEPVWRFAIRLLRLRTESRLIAWTLREN